ncbi:MAG: YtfJ family protein [Myxococcota bacterium]|nr:YtfJ family protein [Myxococcota bacterium]
MILLLSSAALGWEGLDAQVIATDGKPVQLASRWGKPTVLFYEDKDSGTLNQALKDALFRQGAQQDALGAVTVIAVANVREYDWFPARNFVVSAVKDSEKKVGIPVYLDWEGRLSRSPFNLRSTGSTVMVLDGQGRRRWSKTGALSPGEVTQVLALLGELVGTR